MPVRVPEPALSTDRSAWDICRTLEGEGGDIDNSGSTPAVKPLLQAVPFFGDPLAGFQLRQQLLLVRRRLAGGLTGSLQLAAKVVRLFKRKGKSAL